MKMSATLFPSVCDRSGTVQRSRRVVRISALAIILISPSLIAQTAVSGGVAIVPTLTAIAGSGSALPSTTAQAATAVKLNSPFGVAVDNSGNSYIADQVNGVIEQVTPAGQIVVVAGGGSTVPTTTSITATTAKLNNPTGVAVDLMGNLYIADQGNNVVEEVSGGMLVVLAGDGNAPASTSAVSATAVTLNKPSGVAVDTSGDVYIADAGNRLIEEVTAGQIVVVAGSGNTVPSFSSESATSAQLSNPTGVAVDASGDIYIADTGNGLVEEVSAGTITAIAGGGNTVPTATLEAAAGAALAAPTGVAVDLAGNVYIADSGNNLTEEVIPSLQQLVVIAGGGATVPSTQVAAKSARLSSPTGVAINAAGSVYIADRGDGLVEQIASGQILKQATAVGSTSAAQTIQIQLQAASVISSISVAPGVNGVKEFALGTVTGCSVGSASNLAGAVCAIPVTFSPAYPGLRMGTVVLTSGSNVLGTIGVYGTAEGPEIAQLPGNLSAISGGGSTIPSTTAASPLGTDLNNPLGVALDGAGNLFVVAGDKGYGTIDKISATTGLMTVIAGGGSSVPSTTPMAATSANIYPFGVAVDAAGNVYIGDYGNGLVEKVDATSGQIVVIAGGGSNGPAAAPIGAATAAIYPFGVAVDKTGNLYIADKVGQYSGGQIEEVPATSGQIVVLAGAGGTEPSPTPEPAAAAGFYQLLGLAVDGAGNIYIADAGDDEIAVITASTGEIQRIAGFGSNLPSATPVAATTAALNNPSGVTVDAAGNVYIADTSNGLVEKVNLAGEIVAIAGGGTTVPSTTVQAGTSAQLNNPTGLAVDGAGNLYITDSTNGLLESLTTTTPPLVFSDTNVGTTNSVQPTVTLANIGNQPLTITSVTAAVDFPFANSTTCTASTSTSQTLASDASCSLVFDFTPTTSGALSESISILDNDLNVANSKQTISMSGAAFAPIVAPPTYALSSNVSVLNLNAGQTGSAVLTITPVGAYSGMLALICTNLPANTACSFSQSGGASISTIALTGSGQPVQVNLAIATNATQQAAADRRHDSIRIFAGLAFWSPFTLIGWGLFVRRSKRTSSRTLRQQLQQGLLLLLIAVASSQIVGCGNGPSKTGTSPAGTTTVTISSIPVTGSVGESQAVYLTLIITH